MTHSKIHKQVDSTQSHLLIDASIYIFQYYFSLPDNWFSQKDNWPTAAVYGYTTFLMKLLNNHPSQRMAACFDESLESCFRNDIYPNYKSSRALPDAGLAFQLKACRKVTDLLGIKTFASQRYEADDLLGSLYQVLTRSKTPIAILTRDKDLAQVIKRPQDFLWDYSAKTESTSGNGRRYYTNDIESKFGVRLTQLVDYLALVGDSIDDIPGVSGIGAKTASLLLSYFDNVEALIENNKEVAALPIRGASSIAQKLVEYQDQILLSKQLATIVLDLPLINKVNDIKKQKPDFPKLENFCCEMGFPKLFSRIKKVQV